MSFIRSVGTKVHTVVLKELQLKLYCKSHLKYDGLCI